jgi:hypothetical protein
MGKLTGVLAAAELEDADLFAFDLAQHFGAHLGAGNIGSADLGRFAFTHHQHPVEDDLAGGLGSLIELDLQLIAFPHFILTASVVDNRVHLFCTP